MGLVLKTLTVQLVQKRKDAVWIRTDADSSDIDAIREAGQSSAFDPLRLRANMVASNPRITARELRWKGRVFAKVVVICERGRQPQIPWLLYRDIFTAFGECHDANGPWRVLVFCAKAERLFPPEGQQPGPENLNGGYAIPGDPRSVVIYREEESYRVLLHELLHACGSDNMEHPEWLREALTETWAELFLVAILSGGSVKKAFELWNIQAQWIADQEFLLQTQHGVKGPDDYAFRYTVGRRHVLKGLGFSLPPANVPLAQIPITLRFTSPALLENAA